MPNMAPNTAPSSFAPSMNYPSANTMAPNTMAPTGYNTAVGTQAPQAGLGLIPEHKRTFRRCPRAMVVRYPITRPFR